MTASDSRPEDGAAKGKRSATSADHQYFSDLEELFISLRGAPLLLSPSDWKTASNWRREGIPFDIVSRVLREVFERRAEAKGPAGVRSLRYFDPAVQRAWKQVRELGVGDRPERPEPLDIVGRLRALEAALPTDLDGVESIKRKMLALRGAADEIESSLMELDRSLVSAAEDALDDATKEEVEREVDAALSRLSTRLDGDSLGATRESLRSRLVRRRLDLPVLSLFSSAAVRGAGGSHDESAE
jgi:hypothetical protein